MNTNNHDHDRSAGRQLPLASIEFTPPAAPTVPAAGKFNIWHPTRKTFHPLENGPRRLGYMSLLLCLCFTGEMAQGAPIVIGYTNCLAVPNYSQSLMNQIGQVKWFFAHASVGGNMMDGVADLHAMNPGFYQIQSIAGAGTPPSTTTNGIYQYDRGNPGWQAKVDLFQTCVNNGWGVPKVNLAVNKFCFIDPTASLSYYLSSMTNLEAAFSATVFVYMTIPLMTSADSDNNLRNVFNDGLREWVRVNSRVLYDIADIEAHDTNGVLSTFTYTNRVCQRLCDSYTTDGGHLNVAGRDLVAKGFYALAAATLAALLTVTVTGITANDKVYDGTTSATLRTNSAALAGVQGGDQVTLILTNAVGTFDTKGAGSSKTVTISGVTITGPAAGKYSLPQPTTTAAITVATLTVSGITATNKVYDGTMVAAIQTSGASLQGQVIGDVVTLNVGGASGVFLDGTVGIGKPVMVSGLTISGADATNYSLQQPAANNANIGVASLELRAGDKQRLYGEPNPVFTANYTGFVNGETFATSGIIGNPSLSTTAVTSSLPGNYPINMAMGSLSAVNYGFNVGNGTLTITASVAPFLISSVILSNEMTIVSWAAISGQTCRLQYKETLADSIWHDVAPDIAATGLPGGNTIVTAQDTVGSALQRYYRVMLVK